MHTFARQRKPGNQTDAVRAKAREWEFTVTRQDPFDLLVNGQLKAHTFLTINGTTFRPGGNIGALSAQYQRAITPLTVTSEPEASEVGCRFGRDFQVQTSAEIIVFTAPGAQGWQRTLNPNQVLRPADQPRCAGKPTVPVTLRGQPSDAAYAQTIEDGEMEHVRALEMLHNKHFVPYYHFVRSLRSTGDHANECAANLRQQIGGRAEQAALGFIFGDLAETRRFDDPAVGTHRASIIPTIDAGCNAITLTATPTSPQTPGLGPGNVRAIPPVSRPVDPARLSVSGNDLTDGVTTLRSFSSPANANLALQVFQHYRITEMLSLGSFEFLLANGGAPSGSLAGLNERNIDPASYQVTFGVPGPADWSIVEVVPGQVNLIHNFGANRDQAYSALELMQRHNFNREVWLGGANHPELKFFRKD